MFRRKLRLHDVPSAFLSKSISNLPRPYSGFDTEYIAEPKLVSMCLPTYSDCTNQALSADKRNQTLQPIGTYRIPEFCNCVLIGILQPGFLMTDLKPNIMRG
jgi:hypothetical protein